MTTTELLLDLPGRHDLDRLDPDSIDTAPGYDLRLATGRADVLAAQQLRRQVLAGRRESWRTEPDVADAEEIDDVCDHLIVRRHSEHGPAQPVATCRLLPPHSIDTTPRGTGLDADRDYGLMPLEALLDSTVEVGMMCVRSDERSGAAVAMLCNGIASYLHLTGYRYLLASIPVDLADGNRHAASFWDLALNRWLVPAKLRCRPRNPIAIGGLDRAAVPQVPPLLEHLMRRGGRICGPPATSEMFGTPAFLVLLDSGSADVIPDCAH